jgi:hypothetical protein
VLPSSRHAKRAFGCLRAKSRLNENGRHQGARFSVSVRFIRDRGANLA